MLLITRHDRRDATDHTVFLARPDAGWIEERTLSDPHELLDAPVEAAFEALARGERPGWGTERSDPLYLVCTNGRRDACCALYGRPLVAALSNVSPHVWESSHIGGHRFAGNLVCLPEALIYGRVMPEHGVSLVVAHAEGRVDVRSLRGRAAWPVAAQAAEIELRLHLGLDRIGEVEFVAARTESDGAVVDLLARGDPWRLTLRATPADPPRATSCRGDKLERPLRWELQSIDRG